MSLRSYSRLAPNLPTDEKLRHLHVFHHHSHSGRLRRADLRLQIRLSFLHGNSKTALARGHRCSLDPHSRHPERWNDLDHLQRPGQTIALPEQLESLGDLQLRHRLRHLPRCIDDRFLHGDRSNDILPRSFRCRTVPVRSNIDDEPRLESPGVEFHHLPSSVHHQSSVDLRHSLSQLLLP